MVDSKQIEPVEFRADSIDPPAKPIRPHAFPVVDRVFPELPVLAEVIGGYPGNPDRSAVCLYEEQLTLPPDVNAVQADVDWQVAEQIDAPVVGVALECLPLQREHKLFECDPSDRLTFLGPGTPHGLGITVPQALGPFPPGAAIEPLLEGLEEREW